jgi:hypothetical protein
MPKRVPAAPHLTDGNRELPLNTRGRRPASVEPAPRVSPEMVEELRQILERKVGRPISTEYAEESARNLLAFGQFILSRAGDAEPGLRDGQRHAQAAPPDDAPHGGPEVDRTRRG